MHDGPHLSSSHYDVTRTSETDQWHRAVVWSVAGPVHCRPSFASPRLPADVRTSGDNRLFGIRGSRPELRDLQWYRCSACSIVGRAAHLNALAANKGRQGPDAVAFPPPFALASGKMTYSRDAKHSTGGSRCHRQTPQNDTAVDRSVGHSLPISSDRLH